MTKQELIENLRTEALKHSEAADWYNNFQRVERLAEYERIKHKTYLEAIVMVETINSEALSEKIDMLRYCLFNEYKFLKKENFDNLAEIEMIKYSVYGCVSVLISQMD